jgi:hypothetical protein
MRMARNAKVVFFDKIRYFYWIEKDPVPSRPAGPSNRYWVLKAEPNQAIKSINGEEIAAGIFISEDGGLVSRKTNGSGGLSTF